LLEYQASQNLPFYFFNTFSFFDNCQKPVDCSAVILTR
jgi:hypothetical protein